MNTEAREAQIAESRAQMEIPKYRSHKVVRAVKLTQVLEITSESFLSDEGPKLDSGMLYFGKGIDAVIIHVTAEYINKHKPKSGGYYVRYEDGYESWSPAKAFESGYTKIGDDEPASTFASLNALGESILEINRANGWDVCVPSDWSDFYKVCTMQALITTETSEAVEAVRKRDFENFKEEMADTLIRVLDCAVGLGIDMDAEVAKKLNRNKTRGYKHGGKAV